MSDEFLVLPSELFEPMSFGAWPTPSSSFIAELLVQHNGDVTAVQNALLTLAVDYDTMGRTANLTSTGARNAINYADALVNHAIIMGGGNPYAT